MEVKPGTSTTEFWLTMLGNIAPALMGLPLPHAALLGAILTGIYTVTRGAVKVYAAKSSGSLHADAYAGLAAAVAQGVAAGVQSAQPGAPSRQ